jgi:dihydroneopterin aldolase
LDPDRTLLVGDTVHDMQAARSAGVIAAAVLIGFDPIEKLASSEPDLIVRDLPAIQRIFGTDIQTCSGEWIEIGDLEVKGRIGVQEQEREDPQRLLVTVRFQIGLSFAALSDQFDKTIDYTLVAAQVEKVVETTRAHLIEKLVSDIGNALMAHFPMQRLEIELRKFVLPNARYVSAKSGWKRV